jgi:hypothetical protein
MMIPEYIRFYGGNVTSALDEYARVFFALINSMYRLQAKEALLQLSVTNAAQGGENAQGVVDSLRKQERGLHGIVEEVRVIKGNKK